VVDGHGDNLKYNAEGPDEEALVEAAAACGYKLVKTTNSELTIRSAMPPSNHGVAASGLFFHFPSLYPLCVVV